jgi:hypothetical protein
MSAILGWPSAAVKTARRNRRNAAFALAHAQAEDPTGREEHEDLRPDELREDQQPGQPSPPEAQAAPAPPEEPVAGQDPVDQHKAFKDLIKRDRPLLQHLITLTQQSRGGDPQLSDATSKMAMAMILARLYDLNRDLAGRYGQVTFEPNAVAFGQLFDAIGGRTLADWAELSKIPDGQVPSVKQVEPSR